MRNKKQLATLSLLRKTIGIFTNFFLSIYLFKLSDDNFNFILLYAAVQAIAGCAISYFLMRGVSRKNVKLIFCSGYISEILSLLMLIVLKENILSVIWVFLLLSRYAKCSFYAVYEITLIGSSGKSSLSSYVAGVDILGTIIALITPAFLGFLITDFSYYIAMIFVLISALISIFIASRIDFDVLNDDFHLFRYWRKSFKNKTMRLGYYSQFLKRLSGPDGILEYLIPILLFLMWW